MVFKVGTHNDGEGGKKFVTDIDHQVLVRF